MTITPGFRRGRPGTTSVGDRTHRLPPRREPGAPHGADGPPPVRRGATPSPTGRRADLRQQRERRLRRHRCARRRSSGRLETACSSEEFGFEVTTFVRTRGRAPPHRRRAAVPRRERRHVLRDVHEGVGVGGVDEARSRSSRTTSTPSWCRAPTSTGGCAGSRPTRRSRTRGSVCWAQREHEPQHDDAPQARRVARRLTTPHSAERGAEVSCVLLGLLQERGQALGHVRQRQLVGLRGAL